MLYLNHRPIAWALLVLSTVLPVAAQTYVPVKWEKWIPVAGQSQPVPEQWLQDDEARIAHSLVLPDGVPKPVPYTFGTGLFSNHRKESIAYFDHLCKTEAGQWIFKTVQNVEGFYFARPQSHPGQLLTYTYELENPWIQRFVFMFDNKPIDGAGWLIQPPLYNYHFVEQPRRNAPWQSAIKEPFIRLFGFTTEPRLDPTGKPSTYFKEKTPMQVTGISTITAQYGYTWRGIKRTQDREHGIAGGELLIYDLASKEVLAVRRQFLLGNEPSSPDRVVWGPAKSCPQLKAIWGTSIEFTQFAFDVLETTEPSTTGKN